MSGGDETGMDGRMSEEPHRGVWQPLPEAERESDQTMTVNFAARIAELDALAAAGGEPLAAPGHGYAPPPSPEAAGWAIPVVPNPPPDDTGDYSVGGYAAPWTPQAHGADTAAPWMTPLAPDSPAGPGGPAAAAPPLGPAPQVEPAVGPAAVDPGPPPDGSVGDGPLPQADAPARPGPGPEPEPEPGEWHGPPPEREPEPRPARAGESVPEPRSGQAAEPEPQAAEPEPEPRPATADRPSEHPLVSYVLRVNGSDRQVTDSWLGESLLYVLRERLGLAGAKDGCEQGECGACSVQVDGRLVASCLVPAATTAGSEVRTVEGLSVDGRPSDVQQALADCGAVQCGFCVPGMAMTVHDLLEGNHDPSELEARTALCGNLCRCSGYRGVLDAVRQVAAARAAAAAAESETAGPRIPHQPGPGDAE